MEKTAAKWDTLMTGIRRRGAQQAETAGDLRGWKAAAVFLLLVLVRDAQAVEPQAAARLVKPQIDNLPIATASRKRNQRLQPLAPSSQVLNDPATATTTPSAAPPQHGPPTGKSLRESTTRLTNDSKSPQPPSLTPYLDSLGVVSTPPPSRSGLSDSAPVLDPYLTRIRQDEFLNEASTPSDNPQQAGSLQPYIDSLSETDSQESDLQKPSPSYLEQLQKELPPEPTGGAIQAVKEGRSELQVKKPGGIHHGFGFRYAVDTKSSYQWSASPNSFNAIYGQQYAPSFSLFYELQPFHSDVFGNFGLYLMAGVTLNRGLGTFSVPIAKPGGGVFPSASSTQFQFYTFPGSIGLNYRMNLLRILCPYLFVGPSIVGLSESRKDNQPGIRMVSYGVFTALGVSIPLDWAWSESWSLYSAYRIQHFYLTLDYSKNWTMFGRSNFASSGFYAGFTFEL